MNMGMRLIIFLLLLLSIGMACQTKNSGNKNEAVKLFRMYCVNCHGIDGSLMTNGAKDLRYSTLSLDERILVITQGRNAMTAFENTLTKEQIHTLAEYTIQLSGQTKHAE